MQQFAGGLSFGGQRSGASLQYLKRLTRQATSIPADTLAQRILGPTTRGISLVAWHNIGHALLTLSLGSRSQWREQRELIVHNATGVDTIPSDSGPIVIPRSGPRYETQWHRGMVHAFGSELRLGWASGRLSFDVFGGHALGGRSPSHGRFWGRSDASIALTRSLALLAGLVLDDGWDTREPSPRQYVTLGARLTSASFSRPAHDAHNAPRAVAAAFRFATSSEGEVTLGIRSATARLVELTGDFVQWRPVRMQRVSADWWELRMPISRGVHRVNVRVDGGRWSAPPGLPRHRDEFGGDAGVLVIP